ncbi:MAG: gluconokinase [Pseudoalteromonas sp.]
MIIIICGVSGTGKTTIGQLLADELNLPFFDADDFHPKSNVQKMNQGIALTDEDRQPWLKVLAAQLAQYEIKQGAVLACSALKNVYRVTLASKCQSAIKWVTLHGSSELLQTRLAARTDHFFNNALLESQLASLELPDYGWVIDIKLAPTEIVQTICEKLQNDQQL